jgi:phosphate transport system permease protein
MSHGLRRYIKPIIELMAAIPSVVLGFMAAFWLLPHIEAFFTSLLLMMLVVPAAIVLGGFAWLRVPAGTRQALPQGIESLLMIGVILLAGALCLEVGGTVESWLFRAEGQPTNWLEGDYFLQWLSDVTGTPFEQRNALLVGFAMSFAVIPIIFSISEEAFSNVPKTLVSGSWLSVPTVGRPSPASFCPQLARASSLLR